jgi:hypothetical protein
MASDFRGIRKPVLYQLRRLYYKALDAQAEALRRIILHLDDEALKAELDANDEEIAPEFEKNQSAFYASVGHALSAWAGMEELLVAIVGMLLRTKFTNAGIVMYSILNFHAWLGVIGDLFLHDPILIKHRRTWNKISERLKEMKNIRDRLAHNTVYFASQVPSFSSDTSLRPSRFDMRTKSRSFQPLTFNQISEFTLSLTKAVTDLTALMTALDDTLGEHEALQKKSSEQAPDQPLP